MGEIGVIKLLEVIRWFIGTNVLTYGPYPFTGLITFLISASGTLGVYTRSGPDKDKVRTLFESTKVIISPSVTFFLS